jgi:DNA polymerase (family 10)
MNKDQVAEVLVSIATLLELKGENPFKTRAYLNAARTIETLSEPLDKVVAEARLADIKGIGDALQQKITELVTTGKLQYYEDLKASIPPTSPDWGPRRSRPCTMSWESKRSSSSNRPAKTARLPG